MFARVLAVTIGCLMHFSLCTGGSFAVLSAGIHAFALYQTSQSSVAPMSYGSIGYLSCVTSKHTSADMTSAENPRCTDATSCLQREFARKRDALTISLFVTPVALPPFGLPEIQAQLFENTYITPDRILVAFTHPGLSSIVKVE